MRTDEQIRGLLEPLGEEERRRLVAAFAGVKRLLGEPAGTRTVVLRAARTGDFGWIAFRHGELYRDEYGWGADFEALVARIVAGYVERDDDREAAWIAEVDGVRAGCVMCAREDGRTARQRVLLVEPWARGLGLGRRLVDECLEFARRAGFDRMVLSTNGGLDAARHIYRRAGFVPDERGADQGHGLVDEHWVTSL